jgi:(p)ppGpp synthase/HD superfamily hydrolase
MPPVSGPDHMAAFSVGHANIEAAVAYAESRHAGQLLGDGRPFISHPLEVASELDRMAAPEHLVMAGVLHDVVEKAGVSENTMRRRFGVQVTRLVSAVTDDQSIAGYAKRKAALRSQVAAAGEEALTLFAADKLSMLRELRREIDLERDGSKAARARRLKHYQRSLAMLEERLPDSSLVRTLRTELQAFEHDRLAMRT